ncbi:PREDICTED: uncharacterized protein LOC107167346 [Diuraphis noxia]|uniref:uncharacterized protein LOC107167346 n=1 Tax=Diuraphis noxia TaxID=143948 RepID=UPI0007635B5A|nr:PREDICTED: uncharacterized protein LOC107167346 [Diuraphis noxia]
MAVSYRVAVASLYPLLTVVGRYRRTTTVFVGRLPIKHDSVGTDRSYYHQGMTAARVEPSTVTDPKMKSTKADDDSGCSVKARDLWVDVNGVATRVLCWGQSIDQDNKHELKRVVLCVCGNPGVTEFYEKFLQEVYRVLNVPVWVLSHAGTNFTLFPAFIKKFLVNITLIIMEGGHVDDHVIRSAVRLVHPMVLRNVFSMAVDEMDKIYDLDYKPLKDNAKRLNMYFGKTDGWCPTSFYDDISKCVPEAETVLCDKGYQHAFVIGYSDEIAGVVCDWLQLDLGDTKPK